MKLVKLQNFQIEIEDELLLLTPFKTLYKKDKSKDKQKFMEFITIIYFVYDPRSDYSYIVSEDLRLKEVCESNGFDTPKFTKEELDCITLYKKLTTTTSVELLKSTKSAILAVQTELDSARETISSLEEKDKITALKNLISTLSLIPKLVKEVQEAEKAVAKEIEEQGRARGGNTKSLMDDGILL